MVVSDDLNGLTVQEYPMPNRNRDPRKSKLRDHRKRGDERPTVYKRGSKFRAFARNAKTIIRRRNREIRLDTRRKLEGLRQVINMDERENEETPLFFLHRKMKTDGRRIYRDCFA
jgi:hypothetical protein